MQVELIPLKGEKNYRARAQSCRRENVMSFYRKATERVEIRTGKRDQVYSDMRRGASQRTVDRKDSKPEGDINGVLYARETS